MKAIGRIGVALSVACCMSSVPLFAPAVWAQQQAQTSAPPEAPMQGASGQSGMMGNQGGMHGTGQMPGGANSPADQAMMQSMQRMQHGMMSKPLTGNADQDFVMMMIPHHQGAIDMARAELQYGKDPMLRRMAREIIAGQEKEIREMEQWQSKHSIHR